jgi:hypothetical protein
LQKWRRWRNFNGPGGYHHKLEPTQLAYAGKLAEVKGVSFYDGGDVLYELRDIPGIWHEQCLASPEIN